MKNFLSLQPMTHPNVLTFFLPVWEMPRIRCVQFFSPLTGGCSEGLGAFFVFCIFRAFRPSYRRRRRRLESPWVGPINAALKRLKLAKVTPGATSILSASSASLFLWRFSDAFFSSLTHAVINHKPTAPFANCAVPYLHIILIAIIVHAYTVTKYF